MEVGDLKKWEDKIQVKAQYIWEKHKVALLISILVVPFLVQAFFSLVNILSEFESWSFRFPDSSNWIGFWGSYLGFIPSGLIAFLVAKQQIDAENKLNILRRTEDIKLANLNSVYDVLMELSEWKNKLKLIDSTAESFSRGDKNLLKKIIMNIYKLEIEKDKYRNSLPYVLKNNAKKLSKESNISRDLVILSENYLSIVVDMQSIEISLQKERLISFDDTSLKLLLDTIKTTEQIYDESVDNILNEINEISHI